MTRPRALISWSSGKDSAFALHEIRREGAFDVVGALTTVNESFGRISGQGPFESPEAVPLAVLIPTFITSELKTAFQIGFMVFIPFLIIDLVVASVLMSMGMMMLSPVLISLPFKIMLFVLVDGWALVMGSLAASFYQ